MFYQMRFPGFRAKAVTLSYDDGVNYDKPLMEIMAKYGLHGTFNVNSEFIGNPGHLTWDEVETLYTASGNEVAVHGAQHLSLASVGDAQAIRDLMVDRENLEIHMQSLIRGMAYANGSADARTAELLAHCGLVYGRTTVSTHAFELPQNWRLLNPTCHHNDPRLTELADAFLDRDCNTGYYPSRRPQMFYLWGHSYEFNNNKNWNVIEDFAKKIGGHAEIWYATNMEIWEYCHAWDALVFSAKGDRVYNPTATTLCMSIADRDVEIPAGGTVKLF